MENVYVERREFEEYKLRLADKKADWDRELVSVKSEVKELRELTTSVSELAQSIKAMVKEQSAWRKSRNGQADALTPLNGGTARCGENLSVTS